MKKLYQLNFKQSNWRKIFNLVLWLIFIVIIAYPQIAKAEIKFLPQVNIPGFKETEIKEKTLAYYISSFYKWSVTTVAILAVIMIMISGLQWIFSAGNPPAIAKAKDQMMSAILGLILVLICIPLLKMINPALVRLSSLNIPTIIPKEEETGIKMVLYLIPSEKYYSAITISEIEENKSGLHFCLGGNSDTGAEDYKGGPRAIVAIIFFQNNKRYENVAIKGFWEWKNEETQEKLSICKKEDGCGDGDDGWDFTIHDRLQNECNLVGFKAPCSAVKAGKSDAIKWVGKRGRFGDPDVVSQMKGDFELKVTMFSRKNEFPEQTESLVFHQTCGIGVERECKGGGKKYCCKEKKEAERGWKGYYYEFHCSLALPCQDRNKNWEEQKDKKKEYCNID